MEKVWRLIVDQSKDGFYNMAKDEAMCSIYQKTKIPILRIYSWDKPFISIGYSQKCDLLIDFDFCRKNGISFVRRITGGAAILHNQEFTYSLVFGRDDLKLPKGVKDSYRELNSFIIKFYQNLGLKSGFAIDKNKNLLRKYDNYCFSATEDFDIVIDNKKIGGNAQRRFRDHIFQHGSIPKGLDYEFTKKIILGIDCDLNKKTTSLDELNKELDFLSFCALFIKSFVSVFNLDLSEDNFSKAEDVALKNLIKEKYKTKNWNFCYAKNSLA